MCCLGVFFSGCIQPRAHTRVYVYATPLGLILMQSVRQSRRNVIFIGRAFAPDKRVDSKQNPNGVKRISCGYEYENK